MLRGHNIGARFGRNPILSDISLSVVPGEIVAILGPNGSGKSTLLSVLAGFLAPETGYVTLDGQRLGQWPLRALAQKRAVLSQNSVLSFALRVWEVALLGRSPHSGQVSPADNLAIARAALEETGVSHLGERLYTRLSGGEQQRVHMARVLAQIDFCSPLFDKNPRYLFLDEPTSSLDLAHQHSILQAARRAANHNTGVVVVLHDLNLAAMYAERIIMLKNGHLMAEGSPRKTLTAARISDIFNLKVMVTPHPTRGCPHIVAI